MKAISPIISLCFQRK